MHHFGDLSLSLVGFLLNVLYVGFVVCFCCSVCCTLCNPQLSVDRGVCRNQTGGGGEAAVITDLKAVSVCVVNNVCVSVCACLCV